MTYICTKQTSATRTSSIIQQCMSTFENCMQISQFYISLNCYFFYFKTQMLIINHLAYILLRVIY